jgi:Flp pilus assembly protein TadD
MHHTTRFWRTGAASLAEGVRTADDRPDSERRCRFGEASTGEENVFRRTPTLWGCLLIVLVLAAYVPSMHTGYVWDDDAYVTANPTLRTWDGLQQIWLRPGATPQYYPLVFTSFWLEYHLWGLHPLGYHLVNVLLHGFSAFLVLAILRRLRVPGAWLAAAIFALHPVHVESVAWITERKNVLSGCFYLAAFSTYLRFAFRSPGGDPPAGRPRLGVGSLYCLALVSFLGALLSKSVTASLPAALLLVLWWKRGRVSPKDVFALVPFFGLGLAFGLHTAWMEKFHVGALGELWDFSFADRMLIAGRALWFYAGKLLWPSEIVFVYARWQVDDAVWWQFAYPAGAFAVLAGLWLARKRIGRAPFVAVAFFAGTLFPALGFFDVYPMRFSFVADHFQYLASIGIIAMAVAGAHALIQRRASARLRYAGYGVAALVLAILGTLTWVEQGKYENQETLWRDTIRKNPRAAIALNNLGSILAERGRHDEAVEYYSRALAVSPEDEEALINLGLALQEMGRLDEAIAQYGRALALNPRQAQAYNSLGIALVMQNNVRDGVTAFAQAIRVRPDFADAWSNLERVLRREESFDEAMELGAAYERAGKHRRARFLYEVMLQVRPDRTSELSSRIVGMDAKGRSRSRSDG